MWGMILNINSGLLALSGVYLIYAFGIAIITWSWKQLVIAILLFIFFALAEVAIAAIIEA